ncbi:MAG: hypothetical protein AB1625_03575 [Acidobacteriota bacterium]
MVTLRCSAKLLARLGIERRPPEPPPPDSVLGDWYATILFTRPCHLALCVSERSHLFVVLEGRRLDTLVPRFLRRLDELLREIGVPAAAIDRELERTAEVAFGAATNRSAIAILNRAAWELKLEFPLKSELSVHDWSLEFAGRPCGKELRFPRDTARALLDPTSRFALLDGGLA